MVDKNIIQSRFTKLGVVPIDNQHYLYATLDNNLIGIIVVIKTCDNHYYDEENIKVSSHPICRASSPVQQQKKKPTSPKEPSLVPVHESSASPKKERSKRNKVIEKESPFVQLSLFEES